MSRTVKSIDSAIPKNPRRRNLTQFEERNRKRQRKYDSPEAEARGRHRFSLHQRRIKRNALRYLRQEGAKTTRLYEKQGRLQELHDLIRDLKESGVSVLKKVYDKDGNLIPLLKLENSPGMTYDKRLANKICNAIAVGKTLSAVCTQKDFPSYNAVRKWYRDIPEFKEQLDNAHVERLDYYLDELFDLMDEVKEEKVGVRQAQFVAEQIKWFAEKIHPRFEQKRGDKFNVNIGDDGKVQFNITMASQELPKVSGNDTDVTLIEYDNGSNTTTGSES